MDTAALRQGLAPAGTSRRARKPGPAAWVLAAAALLSGCVVAPVSRAPVYAPGGPVASAPPAPMYFYPERGQSETQQERDRYECYRWAVRETGFDPGMTAVRQPIAPPPAPPPEVLRDGSSVVGGAATGAVLGAAVSSHRHAGEGAVIGAIFGALLGASAQEARAQAIERAAARRQRDAELYAEASRVPLDNFRRAMSACMQSRGFRVV
jgi:hypothetical protein